jgi:hypothetical protein
MKKLLFCFSILIFCFTFISAQTENRMDWKTFSPSNEEFSIEFSELPVLAGFPARDEENTRLYKSFSNETYVFITSDKNIKTSHYKSISLLAEANNTKGDEKVVDNFNGRKFRFTDSEGFHQEILAVEGKKRFYIFHTVSQKIDNPAVERFFASIKLNNTFPEKSLTRETKTEAANNANPSQVQNNQNQAISGGISAGSGTGSGDGNGSGRSGGSSTDIAAAIPKNQTSPLNVLSKPKPAYTDLARIYQISGSVMLRVIFRASGEIGSIAATAKLPFGLTNNAISAAKNIRFAPAMRDGIPFNIAKQVQYTFILY